MNFDKLRTDVEHYKQRKFGWYDGQVGDIPTKETIDLAIDMLNFIEGSIYKPILIPVLAQDDVSTTTDLQVFGEIVIFINSSQIEIEVHIDPIRLRIFESYLGQIGKREFDELVHLKTILKIFY